MASTIAELFQDEAKRVEYFQDLFKNNIELICFHSILLYLTFYWWFLVCCPLVLVLVLIVICLNISQILSHQPTRPYNGTVELPPILSLLLLLLLLFSCVCCCCFERWYCSFSRSLSSSCLSNSRPLIHTSSLLLPGSLSNARLIDCKSSR